VRAWQSAVRDKWPHGPTRVLVSLKANPTIALRRILNDEGAGCDVFGASELDIALAAGTPAELISVNGSTKPETLIVRAIAAGARLPWTASRAGRRAAAAGSGAHVRPRLRPDRYRSRDDQRVHRARSVGSGRRLQARHPDGALRGR
jgi:diaminopimelate decarboxylase